VHTVYVEFVGWTGSADDQLYAMVVKNIDQPGETPSGVGHFASHAWNSREKQRVMPIGQPQVIIL
jgi:hypothetical protein